jgi:hypothetical protein
MRLAEVLSALSLTTDLGAGMPFEKGLRTCVAATAFASALRLRIGERRAVFHTALLRSNGCTAHAPEDAAMFGDDIAFERALKELDPADEATFTTRFGDWDPRHQQAVLAHFSGGSTAAQTEVARRAGGQLDPELCAQFAVNREIVLGRIEAPDMLAAVIAAEPSPTADVADSELDRLCLALAMFTDLKGLHLIGHSTHVADLAVSSEIWNRPGPIGAADVERVRLHSYWTERVLARSPAMARLSPVAAAHHERLDGSGYHRGASAAELTVPPPTWPL